jgi:serine/threonine-protein kinase
MLTGRYRIISLLGRGGMGEVYRADDLRLNQAVALKFLPAALEEDPAARERLLAEVRHARSVSHPNVCRVYDVGEVNGRCFLTMEYIDGEDLASLLRRIGRLPGAKALEIARQLCAGLAAAHDRGLLHRDLKPANAMIDGRGHARITDFGLAVDMGSHGFGHLSAAAAPGIPPKTGGQQPREGLAGTSAYMAPERFEGKPATVQSDLYALGLILYEAYTGKPAITPGLGHAGAVAAPGSPPKIGGLQGEERGDVQGLVRDWRRAHTDSTPASPSALVSEIESAVERVILRCLEKDPAKRPTSAAQVASALPGGDPLAAALAAGETPSPELVAASGEEGTLPRAKAWLLLGACLAAMVLVFAIIGWVSIVNLVPFDQDPAQLRGSARTVLREFGHAGAAADNASWFRADPGFPDHLVKSTPPSQRFRPVPETTRGPVFYCYRQSPRPLLPLVPGFVQRDNPPADDADDAYIELDTRGRLIFLRITVDPFVARLRAAAGPAWDRIFSLARLDAGRFQPVQPT